MFANLAGAQVMHQVMPAVKDEDRDGGADSSMPKITIATAQSR